MSPSRIRRRLPHLLLAALVACASGGRGSAGALPSPQPVSPSGSATSESERAAMAQARADSVRHPWTSADVRFMSDMIGHHGQAIVMSRWAETHGASSSVRTLAARIINAQRDEIATMQQWLRDRGQPVPDPDAAPMKMMMNGAEQEMLMPGMLTEAQMKALDAARGREFDRLFLTGMIQHHRGAVTMVNDLVSSYGAAQDDLVFKLASDINVDQTTEIARMQRMLFALAVGSLPP